MSDDGYVADSPYDGVDDYYFWDDAVSQDVADDLAERTMPSPVYLEDPAYEMMGGYSDWEYYSDDYYDDDPNLLKNNPQAGSPPATLTVMNFQADSHPVRKRGKKRKLADTRDIPALSLAGPGLAEIVPNIGHNITGTTWKTDRYDAEKLYHQGEAKRVALLKDWRNVFRESQPKSDRRSKSMLKNEPALLDEWANDLGLADMGLLTATGKHISTNDIGNDYDADEVSVSDYEQGRPFQDKVSSIQDGEMLLDEGGDLLTGALEEGGQEFHAPGTTVPDAQSPGGIRPSIKRKKPADEGEGTDVLDSDDESDIELPPAERVFSTPKRRKINSVSSSTARSTRNSNATTSVSTGQPQAKETQKRGRGRPRKKAIQLSTAPSTSPGDASNATTNTAHTSVLSKKRKASTRTAEENNHRTTAATVGNAAKRVASNETGLRNDGSSELLTQLPKTTTRDVRPRKK